MYTNILDRNVDTFIGYNFILFTSIYLDRRTRCSPYRSIIIIALVTYYFYLLGIEPVTCGSPKVSFKGKKVGKKRIEGTSSRYGRCSGRTRRWSRRSRGTTSTRPWARPASARSTPRAPSAGRACTRLQHPHTAARGLGRLATLREPDGRLA